MNGTAGSGSRVIYGTVHPAAILPDQPLIRGTYCEKTEEAIICHRRFSHLLSHQRDEAPRGQICCAVPMALVRVERRGALKPEEEEWEEEITLH